jgi:hypothetical protein
MAKRSRCRKKGEDVRPADHKVPAEVVSDQTQWFVDGPTYAAFDAHIDGELESLVSRWIHAAAPGSTSFRRIVRQAARRASGQV